MGCSFERQSRIRCLAIKQQKLIWGLCLDLSGHRPKAVFMCKSLCSPKESWQDCIHLKRLSQFFFDFSHLQNKCIKFSVSLLQKENLSSSLSPIFFKNQSVGNWWCNNYLKLKMITLLTVCALKVCLVSDFPINSFLWRKIDVFAPLFLTWNWPFSFLTQFLGR